MKRHILVVAHAWYGDTIGGSFRLASEFAEHLVDAGHRVTYVCCAPDRAEREIAEAGPHIARGEPCCPANAHQATNLDESGSVRILRYPASTRRRLGLGRLRYHVRQTSRLVREVHQGEPVDCLSGHSPLQFLGAIKPLRGQDVHRVFTVHSPFDDELLSNSESNRPGLPLRLAASVARWVDRKNVLGADRVQTDSKYTLDVMGQKHGVAARNKGVVAPGWVDTDQFRPIADRHSERRNLGSMWDTETPIFFTLRRLERRMGLDGLVQAARQLRRTGRRFRVLIGGDGSLRRELQAMIDDLDLRDTVHMLGRIPAELVSRYYASADCFVLPTRALECFGLIALEAFAANTPVIASDVAAIPEIVARQGVGWLFSPGDADSLATRMRQFLDGQLVVTENLRAIAEEYNREKVLQKWTRLLLG